MSISAKDILACADELTKNTRGLEAHARAAVARSYYAAFHACRAWHEALGAPGTLPASFGERGTHVELTERLLNPDPSLSKEERDSSKMRGLALRRLHADRVVADYKLHLNVTPLEARSSLASAKQIIAM